jgi:DNA-binding IclR family transcriptional regulator
MLARYCDILEAVAAAGTPVSAGDLARLTGLPRPTSYRLVAALLKHGLLDNDGRAGHYRLGERVMRLAVTGRTDADIAIAVSPHLKKLVSKTGETAFLSRFRDGGIDLIHADVPSDLSRGFIHPGLGRRPVHACSSAKAIAAYLPEEVRGDLLSGDNERFNAATLTERQAVLDELEITRERGYAVCAEEIDEGVVSIAVPVSIPEIGVVFSLGVVGPARRLESSSFESFARDLKDTARQAASTIQHIESWGQETVSAATI